MSDTPKRANNVLGNQRLIVLCDWLRKQHKAFDRDRLTIAEIAEKASHGTELTDDETRMEGMIPGVGFTVTTNNIIGAYKALTLELPRARETAGPSSLADLEKRVKALDSAVFKTHSPLVIGQLFDRP